MKNILVIVAVSLFLASCIFREYKYKMHCVYDVVYQDTTIRYDTVFACSTCLAYADKEKTVKNWVDPHNCRRNCILISPGFNQVHETTAQIRIISYKEVLH